ncbi:MAG TPA: hypothetical protein VL307_16910 [Chitinophagaceae bacterium]|jgi:hypothetical protein|nr:hypothetical protein [Chitinophagaceae bacterium]
MIYFTQLIYIVEGQESVFDQFESIALPAIARYNGQLLLRIRPTAESFVELHLPPPYELHLVSFENESDFTSFTQDAERQRFLHLKEQSIREAWLIKGQRIA